MKNQAGLYNKRSNHKFSENFIQSNQFNCCDRKIKIPFICSHWNPSQARTQCSISEHFAFTSKWEQTRSTNPWVKWPCRATLFWAAKATLSLSSAKTHTEQNSSSSCLWSHCKMSKLIKHQRMPAPSRRICSRTKAMPMLTRVELPEKINEPMLLQVQG